MTMPLIRVLVGVHYQDGVMLTPGQTFRTTNEHFLLQHGTDKYEEVEELEEEVEEVAEPVASAPVATAPVARKGKHRRK